MAFVISSNQQLHWFENEVEEKKEEKAYRVLKSF